MFHDPGMVVAEPVGGLELRQRILVKAKFVAVFPRTRQLQLIEDAEFHDVSPWTSCCFEAVYCRQRASPASAQFRRMEEIDVRIML